MIKFSFLVPIYNGEKFLDRLFTSLLSQDIPQSEYEIVCVDDCSQDHSIELIEQYCSRNPNIRLLRNDVNRKLAYNVNLLSASAKGKYMWFLGQDDYVEPNCLGKLYKRLNEDSLDVLVFNYRHVREDESVLNECKVVSMSETLIGLEWIKNQFADRDYCQYILGYTWRAIFRTELWRKNNIRCMDGMMYEDTTNLLKSIVYANAVASIPDMLYYYRINSSSITYRKDFVKRGDLIYEFAFMVGQEVETFYNELKNIDVDLSKNLYAHLQQRYNNFLFDLIRTPNEHKRIFYQCVNSNYDFVRSKWHYLNWKSKLLINRILGYPIACMSYYVYKTYKMCKK